MDYQQTLEYISGLQRFGIRLGLHRIQHLMLLMGSPYRAFPSVHVGGTNGKGSVTAFLTAVLKEAGYCVGTYTSPALHHFNERICVNGTSISNGDLASILTEIRPLADQVSAQTEHPTEFEVVTAAAMAYFKQREVDIAIFEVGLGGRLDSTNVIENPLVSVITTVGYDHMNVLGNTLEEIAAEKAGIIKSKSPVIVGTMENVAFQVIKNKAEEQQAPLMVLGEDMVAHSVAVAWEFQTACIASLHQAYSDLKISLLGSHQVNNAALVLGVLDILNTKGFSISETAVREGFMKVKWPARFEVMHMNPIVVIDGAHNPDGITALKKTITELAGGKRIITVTGILADKDWESMIKVIADFSEMIIAVSPHSPRALSHSSLQAAAAKYCKQVWGFSSVAEGLKHALHTANKEDIICVCGSLVTAAEARAVICNEFNNGHV